MAFAGRRRFTLSSLALSFSWLLRAEPNVLMVTLRVTLTLGANVTLPRPRGRRSGRRIDDSRAISRRDKPFSIKSLAGVSAIVALTGRAGFLPADSADSTVSET